jgi:putative FmdB family regulatory protein
MPLYDFRCHNCNHKFEDSVSLTELDTKKVKCPKCKHPNTERLISLTSAATKSTWSTWRR